MKGFERGSELFGQHRLRDEAFRNKARETGLLVAQGPNDVIALDAMGAPAVGLCGETVTVEQAEKLSVPSDNDRGPQYMEQALAAIHQANARRLPLELGYTHDGTTVGLSVRAPADLASVVLAQLAAHYPAATITRLSEDILAPRPGFFTWSASLRLRPDLFPIRRYAQFDDPLQRSSSDPLTALFAALPLVGRSSASVSLTLTTIPARPRIVRRARRTLRRLAMPFFRRHPRLARLYALGATSASLPVRFLTRTTGVLCPALHSSPVLPPPASLNRTHEREDDLTAAVDKLGRHLYEVRVILRASAPPDAASLARAHIRQIAGAFGQFTVPRMAAFRLSAVRSPRIAAAPFLLSCEELATLWHPATSTVRAPAMQVTESLLDNARVVRDWPDEAQRAEAAERLIRAAMYEAALGRVSHAVKQEILGILGPFCPGIFYGGVPLADHEETLG